MALHAGEPVAASAVQAHSAFVELSNATVPAFAVVQAITVQVPLTHASSVSVDVTITVAPFSAAVQAGSADAVATSSRTRYAPFFGTGSEPEP
jgi:hypothetical protein